MARDLTTGFKTAAEASLCRPVVFAEVDTISGSASPPSGSHVYVWNGVGDKSWNGITWKGLGKFGTLTPISESTDMTATGVKLSMSGIPSDMVSEALGDLSQTLPATIWFGLLNDDGSVIANPYVAFKGQVDVADIEDTGQTSTITISAESPLLVHHKPQGTRYTDQDQQVLFPGDRGFEFVDKIIETNISLGIAGRMPISDIQYSGN